MKWMIAALVVAGTKVAGGSCLAQPKGNASVTVEVVEMWCYLEQGTAGRPRRPAPRRAPKRGTRLR